LRDWERQPCFVAARQALVGERMANHARQEMRLQALHELAVKVLETRLTRALQRPDEHSVRDAVSLSNAVQRLASGMKPGTAILVALDYDAEDSAPGPSDSTTKVATPPAEPGVSDEDADDLDRRLLAGQTDTPKSRATPPIPNPFVGP
jgi:hypothetical protein